MALKSKFKKAVMGLGLLTVGSGLFYSLEAWSYGFNPRSRVETIVDADIAQNCLEGKLTYPPTQKELKALSVVKEHDAQEKAGGKAALLGAAVLLIGAALPKKKKESNSPGMA